MMTNDDNVGRELLTDLEEEIFQQLILQFENDDSNEIGENNSSHSKDSCMKLQYEAIYKKALRSYYFYLKPLQERDFNELYEILVQFNLLSLAAKSSDAGLNGNQLLQLETEIEQFIEGEDGECKSLAKLFRESKPKHKKLLIQLRQCMKKVNEFLYNKNIVF